MLIFDLDGTLIDSAEDIGAAVNLTLQDMGKGTFSREEIVAHVGTGVVNLLDQQFANNQEELERARQLFDQHYSNGLCEKTCLFDGMKEVLEHFSDRPMAILTNKKQKYTDVIVEALSLRPYFLGIYGRDAFEKYKPDPLPIERILEIHSQSRAVTWMIGDSPVDVATGKGASVKTCAVRYGYSLPQPLLDAGADVYVDHPDELKKVLL